MITRRLILFFLLIHAMPVFSLSNECGASTSIEGTGYLIAPSGKDDTTNIKCAFQSAKEQGLSSITLAEGDFNVSTLDVGDFEGVFQGSNRRKSKVFVANNVADCGDGFDDATGIFTFFGGNVSVRKMTIDVDRPCSRGSSFIVFRFTQKSCGARTHFANVDRVTLISPSSEDISTAVQMTGRMVCVEDQKGSLGTFKLNRSSIEGFDVGTSVSLLGGGQVDINFNEFIGVAEGVVFENANQNATITGNTFDYVFDGVLVYAVEAYAPGSNRVVVHNNKFLQSTADSYAYGVRVFHEQKRTATSVVISENTFELEERAGDDSKIGIGIFDTDNAVIVSNEFTGSARVGIYVDAFSFGGEASKNTAIIGNSFKQDNSLEDIDVFLGEETEGSVVGRQFAKTRDYGTNNFSL